VIVRRKETDAEFISLLVPSRQGSPTISANAGEDGTITVHGPKWVDTVTLGKVIRYHRSIGVVGVDQP
jgi:hypothetical protein